MKKNAAHKSRSGVFCCVDFFNGKVDEQGSRGIFETGWISRIFRRMTDFTLRSFALRPFFFFVKGSREYGDYKIRPESEWFLPLQKLLNLCSNLLTWAISQPYIHQQNSGSCSRHHGDIENLVVNLSSYVLFLYNMSPPCPDIKSNGRHYDRQKCELLEKIPALEASRRVYQFYVLSRLLRYWFGWLPGYWYKWVFGDLCK